MREKGKLLWNLELRRDISEGMQRDQALHWVGVGARQYWNLESPKPQEVAVGPDWRQEAAKSKLHTAHPNLCWAHSYSFQNY